LPCLPHSCWHLVRVLPHLMEPPGWLIRQYGGRASTNGLTFSYLDPFPNGTRQPPPRLVECV
jgi:hypothetical protein